MKKNEQVTFTIITKSITVLSFILIISVIGMIIDLLRLLVFVYAGQEGFSWLGWHPNLFWYQVGLALLLSAIYTAISVGCKVPMKKVLTAFIKKPFIRIVSKVYEDEIEN